MHDFLLAKEIVEKTKQVAEEKGLKSVSLIEVEIGQIALAHDGFEEHLEDISEENLRFGIENISKGSVLENAKIEIRKVEGEHWKLTKIAGE
jgi:Zn finger protein HypA/HybF involved in hydrogenase expression